MWHAVWMVDLFDPSETTAVSAQLFKANGHLHPTVPHRSRNEVSKHTCTHTILYWEASMQVSVGSTPGRMLIICLGLLGRCLLQLTKRSIIFSPVFCSNFQTWKNPPPDSLSVYIHNGGAQCHQCILEMWEEPESWVWPYVTAVTVTEATWPRLCHMPCT